jgi:hypothetical protein
VNDDHRALENRLNSLLFGSTLSLSFPFVFTTALAAAVFIVDHPSRHHHRRLPPPASRALRLPFSNAGAPPLQDMCALY